MSTGYQEEHMQKSAVSAFTMGVCVFVGARTRVCGCIHVQTYMCTYVRTYKHSDIYPCTHIYPSTFDLSTYLPN
jgi:hypothetical protein